MEDITTIKQQTFELRQYASAIMNDIDNMLDEERKRYKDSMDKVAASCKDELERTLSAKDIEIEKLKNENDKLVTAIESMKSVIGSVLVICEGEE